MKPLEYLLSSNTNPPTKEAWYAAMHGGSPGEWVSEQLDEAEVCWLNPDEDELKHNQLKWAAMDHQSARPDPYEPASEVYTAPSASAWRLLKYRTHPELLFLAQAAWGGFSDFEAAYHEVRSRPLRAPRPDPEAVQYREAFNQVMGNIVQVPHERQIVYREIGPVDLALALVDAEVLLLESFGSDLSPFACRLFYDTWERAKKADQPVITRARFEVGERIKKLHSQGKIAALPPQAYELDATVLGDLAAPMLQLWDSLDEFSRTMAMREFSEEWRASARLLFPELATLFPVTNEPTVTKPFQRHLDDVKSMVSVVHHLCVADEIQLSLKQALALDELCRIFELPPPEETP